MSTTIMGDNIPTAGEWILLLSGKIDMNHNSFRDIVSFEVKEDLEASVVIDVTYISGREETYAFSNECVASGIVFEMVCSPDPRDKIMNAWDGEREQPVI